jgi:hypothetical protein
MSAAPTLGNKWKTELLAAEHNVIGTNLHWRFQTTVRRVGIPAGRSSYDYSAALAHF